MRQHLPTTKPQRYALGKFIAIILLSYCIMVVIWLGFRSMLPTLDRPPENECIHLRGIVSGVNTEGYEIGDEIMIDAVIIDTTIIKAIEEGEYRYYKLKASPPRDGITKIYYGTPSDSLRTINVK